MLLGEAIERDPPFPVFLQDLPRPSTAPFLPPGHKRGLLLLGLLLRRSRRNPCQQLPGRRLILLGPPIPHGEEPVHTEELMAREMGGLPMSGER